MSVQGIADLASAQVSPTSAAIMNTTPSSSKQTLAEILPEQKTLCPHHQLASELLSGSKQSLPLNGFSMRPEISDEKEEGLRRHGD